MELRYKIINDVNVKNQKFSLQWWLAMLKPTYSMTTRDIHNMPLDTHHESLTQNLSIDLYIETLHVTEVWCYMLLLCNWRQEMLHYWLTRIQLYKIIFVEYTPVHQRSHDRAQRAGLPIFELGQSWDLCKLMINFYLGGETANGINKFCFTDFGHYNKSQLN